MGTVEWIVLLSVAVFVGLGLGFFAGRLSGRGNNQKLADVEAELEDYRTKVTEHFSQSAEHFQAIGRQYRELYEHMAVGSEKLCVGAPTDGQLKFPRPDEVTAEKPVAAEEEGPIEAVEQAADEEADAPVDDVAASEPEPIAVEQPPEDEPSGKRVAESDSVTKESEDLETPTAPTDYADDDPKERQYH